MFCWIAKSCRCLICVGLRLTVTEPPSPSVSVSTDRFGSCLRSRLANRSRVVAAAQADPDRVDAVAGHAGERNAFLAQHRAVVALHAREQLLHGALRVDLVQEVDAAAQVEAEAHRLEPQRSQPARRARARRTAPRGTRRRCPAARRRAPSSCVLTSSKRRTSRSPSRYEFSTVAPLACSSETTCWRWTSVTAVRSLRESCSAGASPNTFGRASTVASEQDDDDQPDLPDRVAVHARTPGRPFRRS